MILSNPGYEQVISWLPHGRAWRINNVYVRVHDMAIHFLSFRVEDAPSFADNAKTFFSINDTHTLISARIQHLGSNLKKRLFLFTFGKYRPAFF
jgi:hypothetical protein